MEMLTNLNPEQVTFAGLFIALLVWTMKNNDNREKRYLDTIDTLSEALNGFEDLTEKVTQIHDKVNNNG